MAKAHEVQILLVEDKPSDINLTLRALEKHDPANQAQPVKYAAALEFLFGPDEKPETRVFHHPR